MIVRIGYSGIRVVVVGAEYDRSYWEQKVKPLVGSPPWLEERIGQTGIGETFALTKRSKFVIAFQSGIGIFSVYLGVPTVMWWRPYGDTVRPGHYVTYREEMASAWAPKEAVELGRYLPCIYGRETVDDIWQHIKDNWL